LKHRLVILLILCIWVFCPILRAQIYTTSSATYHTVSSDGIIPRLDPLPFRSTSAYSAHGNVLRRTQSVSYSTAPMCVANGTITTMASQLRGGVITDESVPDVADMHSGPRRAPWVPDENDTPIGEGWDVAILLVLLCIAYGIYLRRNTTREEAK
jgi:hypothetical protein